MKAVLVAVLFLGSVAAIAQKVTPSRAWATRRLLTAAWEGDKKAVLKAIAQGADVNRAGSAYDRDGGLVRRRTTALILASEGGGTDLARLLISHGARLDTQDEDGNTALHQAAMNGEVAITRLLLDGGANWRLKNHYDNTPLMIDEVGDGTGNAAAYDAVARLIHRRMARDRARYRRRSVKRTSRSGHFSSVPTSSSRRF